ncbi:hypothetical protein [Blastococcus deserti]|uniref:Dolichyl-phosphate-mannose-protein mannosyltransferase n=1 Tax=Blastococcus deserti TaxID=2259033 RepID=A0ABW4X756_9ACTN
MSSAAPGERTREPVAEPAPDERPRRPRARLAWVVFAVVAVLATVLVGLHIDNYRQLSVYDEPQHIDYVHRVLQGDFPASGDVWLPETIEATTCRTIDYPAPLPACSAAADLPALPNGGLSMAFIHTPAYYTVAAGAVLLDRALGQVVDDVDAMRLTGVLWLVLALWMLWLLWRDLGVPWQTRAGLSLALTAAPIVLLSQSTVTNDATALAAGAALTVAVIRWDRGTSRLWLPVTIGLVALLLKVTNLAVVLAVCAFVLVRALQHSTTTRQRVRAVLTRRNLLLVGLLGVATVVVGVGWSVVVNARATLDESENPQNVLMAVDRFDPSWLATSMLSLTSPLQPQFYQAVMTGSAGAVIVANLANIGLLALAVVGAARSEPGSVVRALAIAVGATTLAYGPLLTVVNFVTAGVYFGIPARYGLSLVPGMLALAGTAVRTPRGGTVLLVVGAAFYAMTAWVLVR